jgi:hypothetical protein
LPAIIGDDRYRLLVVARQHAFDPPLPGWSEADPITDLEFEHFRMGSHLVKESEAGDNTVVEVDEFSLTQLINIDLHQNPADRAGVTSTEEYAQLILLVTPPARVCADQVSPRSALGRNIPQSNLGSCDADGDRATQFRHEVQDMGGV